MTVITDSFKRTYIKIGDEANCVAVQKAMFKLGFKWSSNDRVIRMMAANGGYIYVNKDCRMTHTGPSRQRSVDGEYSEFTEKKLHQYLAAVELYTAYRKQAKKAQKQRLKLRKQGYTTKREAFEIPPLDKHEGVFYVRRNGAKGFNQRAYMLDWSERGGETITAYKVVYPKTKGNIISIDTLVGNVAKDLGREVVKIDNYWTPHDPAKDPAPNPEDVVEVLLRNGDVRTSVASYDVIGPAPAFQVVGYRLKDKPEVVEAEFEFVEVPEADGQPKEDTNPKKQYGVQNIPLHYWSTLASSYGALAFYNGALKYGKANFANTPVEAGIYIDGAMRHLAAWVAGEEFDPADGVPNLGGVLANIAILLEARSAGTLIDDRPKLHGYLKEREALKEVVKHLNKLHEGKTPKHYVQGGKHYVQGGA